MIIIPFVTHSCRGRLGHIHRNRLPIYLWHPHPHRTVHVYASTNRFRHLHSHIEKPGTLPPTPSITGSGKEENESRFNYAETLPLDCPSGRIHIHPIWLRHHCQCDKCFNKATFQRSRIPSDLPLISTIKDMDTSNSQDRNNSVKATWNDGHISTYHLKWLEINYRKILALSHDHGPPRPRDKGVTPSPGPTSCRGNPPTSTPTPADPLQTAITYSELMRDGNPEGLWKLLKNIVTLGYGLVKDAPPDAKSTREVVQKISHPQVTIYGDFSEWTSDLKHKDTAYTSQFVHLHTDTSYFSEPMGLQMFHCLQHEGEGGVNCIVDGFSVAENFRTAFPSRYDALSSLDIPYHYLDPGKHFFYYVDNILTHSGGGGGGSALRRVRYNPHDMAVINTLPSPSIPHFYEALVSFSRALEGNPTWIKLNPGLIIFLDNWRTLHGRSEFTGFRRLCGAYISRSDWLSRARVLGIVKDLQ